MTRLAGTSLEVRRETFRDGGADVPAPVAYVRDGLHQFFPRTVLADVAGGTRLIYPNGVIYFGIYTENQNRQAGLDTLQFFENLQDALFAGNGADYRHVPILSGCQAQGFAYVCSFAKNASGKSAIDEVFKALANNLVALQNEYPLHISLIGK